LAPHVNVTRAMSGEASENVSSRRPPPRESLLRRHGVKAFVSIIIAVLFAWVLLRAGLPIVPDRAAMAGVRWPLVALHTGMLVCLHFIRAVRWRHLLRPLAPDIRRRRVIAASWIGFSAILILPLRAGEIARPWLIRDRKKITLSAALGTMGAERVIDGLVVTAVLAGALVFVPRLDPLPKTFGDLKIPVAAIPAAGYAALAVFVCAFIAMAVFYFARDFSQRFIRATVGRISPRLADRVAAIVGGLADGLHFLANKRHGTAFIFETLVYWSLNAAGMWVLGLACGLPMTFGHACAVMGVLAIGILVPAGPGLFGAFQASTYGALAMFFGPSMITREGAAYVFLLYVVQFIWHVVAAGLAVVIDPAVLKSEPEVAVERVV
jgi:uncharacterized protein (TIRG00374 family)